MAYTKRIVRRPMPRRRRGFLGLGGFSDNDQCSTIPMGDPYRRPGNYCATPDGGIVTFESNGAVVRTPGAMDPDPAHPAGAGGGFQSGGSGFFDTLVRALTPGAVAPAMPMAPASGMSTTTIALIVAGGLGALYLISRR